MSWNINKESSEKFRVKNLGSAKNFVFASLSLVGNGRLVRTIFLNVTGKVSVHGESVTNSKFLPYHLTPLPFHLPANQENSCPLN